jgi:serine/threonine-protein kinase HipA
MDDSLITHCPGTLASGFKDYSPTALKHVFNGKKVSAILPYPSPASNEKADELFIKNRSHMSISGVQGKFSVVLEKNKLRLALEGEQGQYILKPIPNAGKKSNQMPANEHLTMQIARQVFNIETAQNALIFFNNGAPAYITKRFDIREEKQKWAQEDFAALAGRTPQTQGENYKYVGNYLDVFHVLKKYVPAYPVESVKLFKLILFNYVFSNGDAHFKNFSLIETPLGDFRLSPAYDLLNSRMHIEDRDFALEGGLIPQELITGKVRNHFTILGEEAGIPKKVVDKICNELISKQNEVESLITSSFLNDTSKRTYTQHYQRRLNKLTRI